MIAIEQKRFTEDQEQKHDHVISINKTLSCLLHWMGLQRLD